jgi:signal transduction histidine kinase
MKPSLVGRLMLAYAAVIAAVLASTWWSQQSLGQAEYVAQRLSDRSVEGIDLATKLETLVHERSRLADYLLSHDPQVLSDLSPHRGQFQHWIDQMADFAHTDDEHELLARMREGYATYIAGADEVIRLEQAGRPEEARRRFFAITDRIEQVLADSQRLLGLAQEDMRARRERAEASIAEGRTAVLWLTGLGALFSLALGFILSRYAARPISNLVLRLGTSGMVDRVRLDGDEIGQLELHVNTLLDRVRQQEQALHQAEKLSELGEIASEIAHETLNPVTGVKGMLQALRRTPMPADEVHSTLIEMERQLGRVADIVRRLMSYARPLEPHLHPVDVQTVLVNAAASARLSPAAHDRTIQVDPAPAELRWDMDPHLIEQVLVNLLVNACEASPPSGRVEVGASVEANRLCLFVRDSGTGIQPTVRERLFRPFVTTKAHGNGLGLAVSRNIVREHGGQIEVATEAARGSVFRVLLPPWTETESLCASRS